MSTTTPTEPTPPTSGEPAFGPLRPVVLRLG